MRKVPLRTKGVKDEEAKFSAYKKEIDLTGEEDEFVEAVTPLQLRHLPPPKGQIHGKTGEADA